MLRLVRSLHFGLRSETKTYWERRVALTPDACKQLIENGHIISVEGSQTRVFPNEAYSKIGAKITDNLQDCDVIIGIKEVPLHEIIPDKHYFIFSHTHKAQEYNMPMLRTFMHRNCTLTDYELLTQVTGKDQGKRLVQFGLFAGYAGAINSLQTLGKRLLGLGFWTPFMWLSQAHQYSRLENIRLDIERVGDYIKTHGLPKELLPFNVIFTGKGNVSHGAMSIFQHLPHVFVLPEELENLPKDPHTIYICTVDSSEYIIHKQGSDFDKSDYYENPHHYKSIFHKKIAPHASMLITGHYWDPTFPRLITMDQALQLMPFWKQNLKMLTLGDITCDPNGSIEFMPRACTIDDPYFIFDIERKIEHKELNSEGVAIMSVDILPSEIPKESSEYFSSKLLPFLQDLKKHKSIIDNATIVKAGKVAPEYDYLNEKVHSQGKNKNVAVFGSGMVVQPLVEYLLRDSKNLITLATNQVKEANIVKLNIKKYDLKLGDRITIMNVDVKNDKLVDKVISESDIAVSLVPAVFHVAIAKSCLRQRKNLVTASYISEEMQKLDAEAKSKNLVFLNEMGLDPGIDLTSSKQFIDDVLTMGGKIRHFESWCGGLPAPEFSNIPLGYKFSWSPKAVLTASKNSALYKYNGETRKISSDNLLKNPFKVNIFKGFSFEGIPNRDSLKYAKPYGLDLDTLSTMFRGTLRYAGFCNSLAAFRDLGLLDDVNLQRHDSFYSIMSAKVGDVESFVVKNYGESVLTDMEEYFKLI
eukprot:NODE_175_length_14138_cov_1.015314.p1 type:complete len:754 gc:universal NODE_175_length_14138_cov_1.015314:943-3204(+)